MAISWELEVDHREKNTDLVQMALKRKEIKIHLGSLKTGDYVIERSTVVERKSYLDFAISIVDGRLFRQAAALARCNRRSLFMIEGPRLAVVPVHSHAMKGAILSLSVAWRLPVVFSEDPEDTLLLFKLIAEQSKVLDSLEMPRPGYKPKRLITQKLHVLKGLPGVGPKTAKALLNHFGSVEKVMYSTKTQLVRVAGIGARKAEEIRKVLEAERES